jgi:hypothetical protein
MRNTIGTHIDYCVWLKLGVFACDISHSLQLIAFNALLCYTRRQDLIYLDGVHVSRPPRRVIRGNLEVPNVALASEEGKNER